MRGSHSPQTPVSFRFGELFYSSPVAPSLHPREICPGLWEGRPRLRVSFAEVNVFNFAENALLRRTTRGQRKRERKRRETMTTRRRDENDDDHDDLARLLSEPGQPSSSFSAFYCREARRLLRAPRHTYKGWRAVEKRNTNRPRELENSPSEMHSARLERKTLA